MLKVWHKIAQESLKVARGALLVVHRRVGAADATCAGVGGRACAVLGA